MSRIPHCLVAVMACLLGRGLVTSNLVSADEIKPQLGRRVESFDLRDFRGADHSLKDLQDRKLVVLAFVGTECPLAKLYMPRLVELAKKYEDRGVSVLGISSNQQDSTTELAAFARTHQVSFPILKDVGNHLADQVGAQRTPEVFVLDAERMIRYSGRIDDNYAIGVQRKEAKSNDLVRALDELLAGKEVSVPRVESVGCLIGRVRQPKAEPTVTYSKQIAQLFQNRCEECHRQGEIAPFALTNYDEAVGWAEMIDEVIRQDRMPPWHANPHVGKFANDRRLSGEEKQMIHQWVIDGAPRGNPADLPEPRKYVTGWQLPQAPDQTFYMAEKPFNVPAEGEVKYQYFAVETGFEKDKWVKACQVLPGNRSVVHHIIVFVVPPGARQNSSAGRQHFTAYVPGLIAEPFPTGMAKRIPAGSRLVFQVHYTPVGTPQTDRSQVGFIYCEEDDVKQQLVTNVAGNAGFVIPANDPNYRVESTSRTYPKDMLLLSLTPHMHFRGKSFNYEVVYPDGTKETLLDVPHYDFNWQTHYNLAEPKVLPAGARLHCVAHFDNSPDNLANPDPSKNVRWGDQTWEEMMLGYYEIAFSGEAPPGITDSQAGIAGIDGAAAGLAGADPKELAARMDKNKDGKLTKDELPAVLQPFFERMDADRSGFVDVQELDRAMQRLRQRSGG